MFSHIFISYLIFENNGELGHAPDSHLKESYWDSEKLNVFESHIVISEDSIESNPLLIDPAAQIPSSS